MLENLMVIRVHNPAKISRPEGRMDIPAARALWSVVQDDDQRRRAPKLIPIKPPNVDGDLQYIIHSGKFTMLPELKLGKNKPGRFIPENNEANLQAISALRDKFQSSRKEVKEVIVVHILQAIYYDLGGIDDISQKASYYIRPDSKNPGRFTLKQNPEQFDEDDARFYPAVILNSKQNIYQALDSDSFSPQEILNTIINTKRVAYLASQDANKPTSQTKNTGTSSSKTYNRGRAVRRHISLAAPC